MFPPMELEERLALPPPSPPSAPPPCSPSPPPPSSSTDFKWHRRRGRRRELERWPWWPSSAVLLLLSIVCSCHALSPAPSSSSQRASSSIQFSQSSYAVSIPENALGKVYALPSTRMGIQLNETTSSVSVRYRIRGGDPEGFFKADSERVGDFVFLVLRTRTNNLNVLNRERTASYVLEVRARLRTHDKKRLRAPEPKTLVHVEVTDTNDLDPFFQPSRYALDVDEDTPLHTSIGRVKAEDADEGINGEIYYSIIPSESSGTFAVDPLTGILSLTRPLSFRDAPRHSLTVVAQDRGAKPAYAMRQADTASVFVKVVQVNQHDPVMHIQHLPEVIEHSNADIYAIIRISDPDPDPHGRVDHVEIIEGDTDAHFRIRQSAKDKNEFNIEVVKLLDREISPYGYNLTLKAVDMGTPPRTYYKNVHVQLGDTNDHAPVFDREVYEVRVNESAPVGTPLTRLKVSDEDSGRNAKVRISIVAGNENGQFRINPESGVLYVARHLDAEEKTSYTLTVTALDQANTGMRKQSSAKVRVIVADVNDNDPLFDTDERTVYFDENQPQGTRVTQLEAEDRDSGENGYISYSIANLREVPFEIDHFSGIIRSTKLLDYESDRREYKLVIRASDWGVPYRRQTQLKLTIRTRDINDNRPQFERVSCVGQVPRDTAVGSEILTLSALDFDAGDSISYRIVSGNADGCFSLDSSKGVVSVVCDLRTLPSRRRELNVTATDGQHFSDVTPIVVHFTERKSSSGGIFRTAYGSDESLFECQETQVARRLTEILAKAEKNNGRREEDPVFASVSSSSRSRFGSNIHRPEFDRSRMPREIRVNETMEPGSVLMKVVAHDRDLGFNGDLLYVISEGDTDSVFKIDTVTGDLMVDGRLDRETTAEYMLNVTVFDQGLPQKSASRLLRIIVDDCNDNAPVFFKSAFSCFFSENTPRGTTVVTLNATDADEGLNGEVSYEMDTETDDFRLDAESGLLVINQELDREKREYYDLRIRAVDHSPTNPLSSTAVVRVRVLDVNDNPPEFTAREYLVKAREDLPVGTVVGMVHAHDADLYGGRKVRFSLLPEVSSSLKQRDVSGEDESGDNHHFAIDEVSGTIRIKKRLDYETKQLYNLTVKATDEGSPPLSSTASFVIEILDVNENLHAPRFNSFFLRTAVPENKAAGSHVSTVTAKDLDDPESDDGRISYSIRGGDGLGSFIIDDEGNIRTLVALDRESKSSYWLTVHAQDHGAVPLSSKLYVYVEVLNMNDNVPMTLEPVYYPEIAENSKPFTHVLTLEAHDGDLSEEETQLTYEIVSGNPQSLFHIDHNTGIISTTKRMLDRETQSEHELEVRVSDNGRPSLNSTTRIVVSVKDENDNSPEFLERFYKLEVPETIITDGILLNDEQSGGNKGNGAANKSKENEESVNKVWEELFENSTWESFEEGHRKPGAKEVLRAIAFDEDEGENGHLTFSMKDKSGKLQIDPWTGIVYATESILAGEHYEMLVKAVDGGKKSALSRISMQVKSPGVLGEENKAAPKVFETPSAQVFESDSVGHLVALVVAEDEDSPKLWYSIEAGDVEHSFYISPSRGSILLAKKLDWERKSSYNLTVAVTDGKFKVRTHVLVSVVDVNEKRPEFTSSEFEVEVAENISIGSVLIKMNVTDTDRNQKVFFSFHNAQDLSSLSKFKISSSEGVVKVKSKLDRERVKRHVITVAVRDQGTPAPKTNYARLVINVVDHNDHEPAFLSQLIQTKLHETADIGSEVVELIAVDNDQGENGRISYSIASGNIGNSFTIDEDLGIIRVNRELDLQVQAEYTLVVRATDHGQVALSTTVPVHILLTMSDDAPPRFVRPHYATEVYENQPRGHFIIRVDARSQSALRYQIAGGNEDSMFLINPSTGIIMTQRFLDFEEKHYYNLSVEVTNMYGGRAQCSVNIHVLDVNDNEPRFEKSFFSGRISESASIGSLVLIEGHRPLVIKATDEDTGINSLLHYEIMEETARKFFAIDESTGAIRTIMSLDYETQNDYSFNVRVSDRGKPRLSSESMAKVKIAVIDENDSPPRFDQKEYNEILLLPTFKDVTVLKVNASDPDKGVSSQLRYSIVGGNEDGRFSLEAETGRVIVTKEEEVGASSHYALDVSVSDGKFSDRATVKIQVEQSDNSGLAFGRPRYHATVLENTTKSDVIVVVTVLGADLNENLQFSLLNPTDLFAIGPTSGAIRTTGKVFDREVQDEYELVVEVKSADHTRVLPRVAHVVVQVEVLDLNDNAPMFVNKPYHAVMSKDTAKDASILQVSAVDADAGANGDIYYQLVKGNGELFRVGRKSGQITLRQMLDSYNKEYRLTVAAYDGGTPPYSAEVSVQIKVIDKSVPVFIQQHYKASVKEDVEPYSPVVSVEAESPEEAGKLIYTIEAGNDAGRFSVDYNSGVISVTESLDFETKPHHQLTLRATDGVNGGYAETIVLLGVEDVNDCRPQFKNDSYHASVSESMPVGTNIVTVKATDGDSGINQAIEYSILRDQRSNASNYFTVDSESGEVSIKRQLDHEREKAHSFVVVATDKGSKPLSSTVLVSVLVLDSNDNAPEFEEAEYGFQLSDRSRRGQFVGKVRAVDPDEMDASKLRYAIVGGNQHQIFSIEESSGVLSLVNLHNFDRNSLYSLNISVSDGVYSGQSRVRISLFSANSHSPVFDDSVLEVEFAENQLEGTTIGHVLATDEDRNDRVRYQIQSEELSQIFSLDAFTGELKSLHSLDREEKSEYEIPIVATDIGGRNGFTLLKVTVTDENDNAPVFALSEYKANIFANTSLGSNVVKVSASDKDAGRNSRLKYSIYENQTSAISQVFDIHPQTGQIVLKKSPAELENQIYQFFVRAEDQGIKRGRTRETPKHADVPVEVYIMSPLDRPPVFEKRDTVYYISENSPVGRLVATMQASTTEEERRRRDDGRGGKSFPLSEGDGQIRYKIASSEYQHEEDALFQINELDGRLIVNGQLDRETQTVHKITLLAETDASPTLNSYYDLTVQVLDQNDNAPEFQSHPYEVIVSETVPPHTPLVQTIAKDLDYGNNGEVRYSFGESSQHFASVFSIDTHDGWITTQGELDFETQKEYELEVVARDNGDPKLSASTLVRVKVVDANDNKAEFSQRHYSAAVNEGALPGTIIFQLITEDKDTDASTDVEFFIVKGDPKGQFQIKKNGEMYVSRDLDRETKSSYRLEVAATDGTFVTTCRVSIEILDDNDSPPVCPKHTYAKTIEENANAGTYLLTVLARDADEGANAKQVFYLTGDDADMFTIDRDSGAINTALPLDRERIAKFSLEAHAQDAGVPEWECTSRVEITVLDTNDNAPEWTQEVFSATMKEDMPVGTVATKIHATDADLGDNKRLKYALTNSADGYFRIDSVSGIVTLSKPLDREMQAMYNLTVRAMDSGRPRMSSTTNLLVMILDVNDNPPEFASKYYFATVKEDVGEATDVVRVLATSKDSGINADITYSIIGGNQHRKFNIDPKSGVILVAGKLDHEKSKEYFLTIQAMDGGDPPLSNHATVNITVVDTNDNTPIFSQVSYNALISEASQLGQSVTTVTASDADSEENGRVSYRLLSGDRHNQFAVHPDTGLITVASVLDREMVSSYVLEIEAADHGRPKALTASVLVNVDISDANDNPPIFPEGNYTAYVQEDKPIGHILQRFTVTDADDSPNGSPFTFDIRSGNENNAFRVVQDGTLRTAAKFNHKIKKKYLLQVRVFDNGTPPLYSDSYVTVNIIEESQYPPVVVPLDMSIYSYQDDFPGALIGRVKASDQDPYDQLRYELLPMYSPFNLPKQSHLFEIDHNEGSIIALQGLDVGSYSLNISVSDGKFTTFSQGRVVVELISDEMLEDALIIGFKGMSPKEFVHSYERSFVKMIKTLMKVRTKDVVVLSVQEPKRKEKEEESSQRVPRRAPSPLNSKKAKKARMEKSDMQVLFLVKKSKDDFYSREKLRSTLEQGKLSSLAEQVGLSVTGIQQDDCQSETCGSNGICRDVVSMDEGEVTSISTDANSFVAPKFKHETLCQCKEGFAGDKCQIILNECARQPCPTFKVCVPDSSFQGYQCRCPEGLTGALCNVNITDCKSSKCNIVNPMSFGGKSYAQYDLLRSVERHLSVSLSLKTLHATGSVMYAVGVVDYSVLEIVNGKLRYRFNFGSGEGLVTLNDFLVNDGEWHSVRLERHGNNAKISLDDGEFEEHGSAPGVNDVLNLEESDVYFGAEVVVHRTPTNGEDINKGFVGCIDDIRVDGISLPLHLTGDSQVAKLKRFNNIEFKCGELTPPGICGSHPCQNGGTCQEQSGGYICACPSRFTGTHCEYDLDPCASDPCLFGGKCVNLKNDFHCECPPKLSGKRCHYGRFCNPNPCENGGICEEGVHGPICKCRGFTGDNCTVDINECLHQNPCHNGGTCINSNGGFHCICPERIGGPYCNDLGMIMRTNESGKRNYTLTMEELVAIIASLFFIVLIVMCCVVCKGFKGKQRQGRGANSASYHIQNDFDKQETVLLNHRAPDSVYSKREQKLNNLELAAQERPLISPPRPLSCYAPQTTAHPQQQETAFNYVDTVRSYGSAADELESLPRISHDYIQNIQKPMAAVAPSICNAGGDGGPPVVEGAAALRGAVGGAGPGGDRNLIDNYFYPNKPKNDGHYRHPSRLRVNLPTSATDSPGLKGATSLSSLPISNAEDSSQRYYWDSFDLNNDQCSSGGVSGGPPPPMPILNEVASPTSPGEDTVCFEPNGNASGPPQHHVSTLPPPGKPVDPTRDIETLNEDTQSNLDVVSTADTEDEPQLGSVFPQQGLTKSFEELLALNDDINFADDDDDNSAAHSQALPLSPSSGVSIKGALRSGSGAGVEQPNSYDYQMLHLNNYLPTYNVSETDTDEQTPIMLARNNHSVNGSPNANLPYKLPGRTAAGNANNDLDTSSEMNGSISALPEDPKATAATSNGSNGNKSNGLKLPGSIKLSSTTNGGAASDLDNLCELEDSDDETPTVEIKPMAPMNPRVTRV